MNVAILTVSSLSLAFSVGTFFFMKRTADDIREAKQRLESEIDDVKDKMASNARVIKSAIGSLEV